MFATLCDEVDEADAIFAEVGPALGKRLEAGSRNAECTRDGGLGGILLSGTQQQIERQYYDIEV